MGNPLFILQHIHALDAHIHASSILIRKQPVGMPDAWESALHHVIQHARIRVLAVAWEMIPKKVMITNPEKDKDAHRSVPLIV